MQRRTSISLLAVTPIVFAMVLQLGGCARTSSSTPAPGGTYISKSAGANFDQSVQLKDSEDNIAGLTLQGSHRDVNDSEKIYVAAGQDGLVVSEDGGETWEIITTPLQQTLDIVALQNGTLVISGVGPDNEGFVMRSLDDGKSWFVVLSVPLGEETGGIQIIGNSNPVTSVVFDLALDPRNPNRLYAGSSLGSIFIGEQSAKVWRTFRTLDSTFFGTGTPSPENGIQKVVPSPFTDNEILVITADSELWRVGDDDQELIEVPRNLEESGLTRTVSRNRLIRDVTYVEQAPDALFVGVDDGAVISRDAGQTWTKLNLPVETTENFSTVVVKASPTNPSRLLVAINDVIYRSEDGGQAWNTRALVLPNHVIVNLLINPENAAKVLAVTRPVRT